MSSSSNGQNGKNGKKTTSETAFIVGKNGGKLNPGGTPGNKGGGRPPDEFKARMRELADIASRKQYAEKVIKDTSHPHWLGAAKWVADRGYGPVEHKADVSAKLVIEVVRRTVPMSDLSDVVIDR